MPIFDIQTHLQFYDMLVDDFDDLMREQHSARRAFHCIMEAYHLREWVWHDLIENNQKLKDALKITSESDFNGLINRSCIWFPYFRAITNGSKHFEMHETGVEAFKVEAAPFSLDTLGAGFDAGAWNGPVRYVSGSLPVGQDNKGVLLFDFGEPAGEQQRFIPVLHVIEAVVRFWRDTLRTFHPGVSIKSSPHHNEP
ncbi:hypothetical protein ACYCVF_35495 [Bradyrhizobium sp. 1.29L]